MKKNAYFGFMNNLHNILRDLELKEDYYVFEKAENAFGLVSTISPVHRTENVILDIIEFLIEKNVKFIYNARIKEIAQDERNLDIVLESGIVYKGFERVVNK